MRVVRGVADTRTGDGEVTKRLVEQVGAAGEPAVRVWRPDRQVAFGRRDARADGYRAAREAAREHGFASVERSVGGRAVAYTGSTVAFARIEPIADIRTGLEERYEAMVSDVQRACWRLGAPAQRGEPPESFCPGAYSLQYRGKLAGVAQRVTSNAALVSGVLVVDDHREIGRVLDDVYGALGVPFDPRSVGSLERAGATADPVEVLSELEAALAGENHRVESVRQT
ncbi:lipoate--protein ligase family protein [Salarchaeum sp. JOR-1]|uniref:lipoate--protein ligase family protein n=1 Tax=Salarchaeum sp. JOR-1 TaxID=2599399 RepID=UPI001198825F|nr:lipoate--protein ligase family protein [Salarchaeum sp. JOR-1]QDX40059.1 lipoate--protein ligase family protein [Salarchaeum sp. JOR-1]